MYSSFLFCAYNWVSLKRFRIFIRKMIVCESCTLDYKSINYSTQSSLLTIDSSGQTNEFTYIRCRCINFLYSLVQINSPMIWIKTKTYLNFSYLSVWGKWTTQYMLFSKKFPSMFVRSISSFGKLRSNVHI